MRNLLLPIFDTFEYIKDQNLLNFYSSTFSKEDFKYSKEFLLSYQGNEATFNAYRRETERLLQWAWLIAKKSIRHLKRHELETYIEFCQNPPLTWTGVKKTNRYLDKEGQRIPNPEWRPFVSTVSKIEFRKGLRPDPKEHHLSEKALREIFTVLGCFYNFLIQENYTEINPILNIRQKSRYFRNLQGKRKIRRLSELQWEYVIETAEMMAKENPEKHEKTLFMISALYLMYLRISEVAASERWLPKMSDFYCDHDGLWWFTTVGKGNKERQISVSDSMLKALRRYRQSLGLTPLPSPADNAPLFPKYKGKGPIT